MAANLKAYNALLYVNLIQVYLQDSDIHPALQLAEMFHLHSDFDFGQ